MSPIHQSNDEVPMIDFMSELRRRIDRINATYASPEPAPAALAPATTPKAAIPPSAPKAVTPPAAKATVAAPPAAAAKVETPAEGTPLIPAGTVPDEIKVEAGRMAAKICEDFILRRMDNAVQIGIRYAAKKMNLPDALVAEAFAVAIKNPKKGAQGLFLE
jgi:hypothetical protein